MRRLLVALSLAALALPVAAAAASAPNDPLVARQWYLTRDHALDVFDAASQLMTIRVAVIDSGIERDHPELRGRVIAAKSFVDGSVADTQGHGTFVAGEIAALADNGAGIAGLAPPARLIVAKVVRADGSIPDRAEARAIRWAARQGARVINLSLGSTRDPSDPSRDGYSRPEQRAIEAAVRRGALVVAAVGNGNDAPAKPWSFASYPAAFPHVLGVAAYGRSGGVPQFSNRDDQYVDLAAPGMDIFSLFPRQLTQRYTGCDEQGYSSCGTKEFRHADGTSFSAPQVAAAAAVLFALNPVLRPDQVGAILKDSASDATPANGCGDCTPGPDPLTGFGRLDISAAMQQAVHGPIPPADRLEPNDDAGGEAAALFGTKTLKATLDWWDDPVDVYRVYLKRGQRISVAVRSGSKVDTSVILWKPGLHRLADARSDLRAKRSIHAPGVTERLAYRSQRSGWFSLQVKLARPGMGPYRLRLVS